MPTRKVCLDAATHAASASTTLGASARERSRVMIYVQCGFTGLTANVEGRSRLCKWGLPLIW